MALLAGSDLEVRYGRIRGTHGLSFSVEEGEILALVGSNGAGKSSTLKAILGMADYPSGRIEWRGETLKGCKPYEVIRRGIGFSPEGRRPFQNLTVTENLKLGGYTRSASEVRERMEEVFGYLPRLRERARQRAGSMSGGEQQMLAIGRALMCRPKSCSCWMSPRLVSLPSRLKRSAISSSKSSSEKSSPLSWRSRMRFGQ